jgi:hypothetical protein
MTQTTFSPGATKHALSFRPQSLTNVFSRRSAQLAVATAFCAVFAGGMSKNTHAGAFKCQTPEGRVEYSDRPCETTKTTLDEPKKSGAVTSRPSVRPIDQLNKLMVEFEPALCERERLAAEVDRANRLGTYRATADEWKGKAARLHELNDLRVTFQTRARRIVEPTGRDSAEAIALQKFSLTLKNCDRAPPKPILTNPPVSKNTSGSSNAPTETKPGMSAPISGTKNVASSSKTGAPPAPK